MKDILRDFIQNYLNVEVADDDMIEVKKIVERLSPTAQQELQDAFAELLTSESLTTNDYFNLTLYAFDSTEEMYEYLDKVFAVLYKGLKQQPYLP